jgi:hypothetical protein
MLMLSRRLALMVGILLCVANGGLVLGGASASAFSTHLLSGSFSGSGAGALSGPAGVAVNDETGDVYVIDEGHNRVEEFDASGGTPLGAFDGVAAGHPLSFSGIGAIAVDNSPSPLDPSRGDVYVADTGHDVIDKFSASGTYLGQIVETTGGAAFSGLFGVAVDANGAVWVYQRSGEIDSFSDALSNEYLSQRPSPFEGTGPGFGVDSAGGLYVVNGQPFVGKSSSSGVLLIEALDHEESFGVAVNVASDEVLVDNITSIGVFDSSGSPLERFGAGQIGEAWGVAVNSSDNRVYAADHANNVVEVFDAALLADVSTEAASNVAPRSVRLNGTVNPAGVPVTSCFFEYGADTFYGHSAPCAQSPGSGSAPVAVSADLSGLKEGTTYHFRLVATNGDGANRGSDGEVTTLPSPVIDGASATNVTASTVDLSARIDPRGYDTTYRFEYGTSTSYGASIPIPDADIGAGTSDVTAAQHVAGLQTNTTYHWRVVAHNVNGTATGQDHTFIYSTAGTSGLPDNRAYEMVTPPAKNAALIGDVFAGISPDISEDGSRLMLSSIQCFGDSTSCPVGGDTTGTPFEFTRTSGGWSATALAPSATRFDSNNGWAVSADAGSALFSMPTPPLGESDFYARSPDGSFQDIGPAGPPAHNPLVFTTTVRGTADLSHVAYESGTVWPFDETTGEGEAPSLYEFAGVDNAAPVLVGVSGGAGSTDLISKCRTGLGNGSNAGPYGAMSGDGRTVFFTAGRCASGSGVNTGVEVPAKELYARIDRSRTVPISQRSPLECTSATGCLGSQPSDAWFVGASADGSRAFFLDTQQLTDNASEDGDSRDGARDYESCPKTVAVNGCNLYEYDFANPAGRSLVAVSAGDSSGGGPRVQGVLAISADGSHVYFVAKGVLTSAANDRGQTAQNGALNMYVFERDTSHPSGRVAFIASLPESDNASDGLSVWTGGLLLEDVTPDGRFLVFKSHAALTADDSSSTGAAQVFRYDAQTDQLIRISVGESGFNDNGNAGIADASIVFPDAVHLGPPRGDPTMSHDGAYVFFESPVALTPGALNEVPIATEFSGETAYARNVYEWHEGHVYLLSDGRDVNATISAPCHEHQSSVCLLGSDATGRNVFLTTAGPLVAADTDTQGDVYDARICTASEPCAVQAAAPVPCQGEACHGTPGVAPGAASAATVTFSGPGNLAPPAASGAKPKAKKHTRGAHGKRAAKKRKTRRRAPKRHAKSLKRGHGHSSRAGGK